MERRTFLKLPLAFAAAGELAAQTGQTADKHLKVLIAGGHPGDPEYGCGGTIARYVERGDQVKLLYLNRGEKGCSGKSQHACGALRSAEAKSACQLLGAAALFADQIDGEAEVTPASYDKFAAIVEAESPDVVFTHWPVDNHRDHRAAFNLTYDAWLRAKKSFGLYFYEVSDGEDTVMFTPTDYVDIGRMEEKKRSACFAHASQSPERFYALQSEVARFRGVESGFRSAEAFMRHRESAGHLLP
jgi:LmbE family N-acetylglucosaminyl deacetylase